MAAQDSTIYLGLERSVEESEQQLFDGALAQFYVWAQRVMWGVTQADVLRVSVPAASAELRRRFPEAPAALAVAAYGARASGQADVALEYLEQARTLATPGHPHARLIATEEEWRAQAPAQELEEIVEGRIWRLSYYAPMAGSDLPFGNAATLVRCEDGRICIINPVPCSADILARIKGLGPVSDLVVQGKAHSRNVQRARGQFPGARVLGSRGHRAHPPAAGVHFDAALGEPGAELPEELREIHIEGTQLEECLLFHQPTGVLIVQDFLTAEIAGDRLQTLLARLYAHAFGIHGRVGLLAYQAMVWTDLARIQQGARALLGLDYSTVLGAHFGAIPTAKHAELEATLRWITELTPSRLRRLQFKVWWSQPAFLSGYMRYRLNHSLFARWRGSAPAQD